MNSPVSLGKSLPFSGLSSFSCTAGELGSGVDETRLLTRILPCPLFFFGPELNALQEELAPFGLVVLGFPCNQFGQQEPGENSEILPSLKYVRPGGGFVPNFQLFEKGDVNGEKEQKFYTFLKNSCPPTSELLGTSDRLFWEPMKVHDIRWNFEKFLVGPDGMPIMRWHHRTTVSNVKMDILLYMRHRQAAQEVKRK
ncbi:Glutathione peroxidase 3 [Plecturocebus cupreus]